MFGGVRVEDHFPSTKPTFKKKAYRSMGPAFDAAAASVVACCW